jgi:MFS family permease
MLLSSFGQAILLPMSPYLAERWFPLEERSLAISLSFYSNLVGFAFGAIFTTLYITSARHILEQLFIISIISTFCFMVSVILVKNKPKVLMEKYKIASFKQIKELWKYKFNTYSIIMSSVFLGVSWTFLSNSKHFVM